MIAPSASVRFRARQRAIRNREPIPSWAKIKSLRKFTPEVAAARDHASKMRYNKKRYATKEGRAKSIAAARSWQLRHKERCAATKKLDWERRRNDPIKLEESRKSARSWILRNKDRAAKRSREWGIKLSQSLADKYICGLLCASAGLQKSSITHLLIEAKREHIKVLRLIKEIKK